MPLFDYECEMCGCVVVDHMVPSYKVDVTIPCPECPEFFDTEQPMHRKISPMNFALKGGGWAAGGYVKEVYRHGSIKTTVEGDTRILR